MITKVTVFAMILFLFGCAGTRQETAEEKPQTTSAGQFDESFDPNTLDDADITVLPTEQETSSPSTGTGTVTAAGSGEAKVINGFRVQILATSNLETASLVEQEATERFSRLGHRIYLLFEAPLYKIRLGDCTTRNEAEELRDLSQEYGYRGAFIVKSKINVIR